MPQLVVSVLHLVAAAYHLDGFLFSDHLDERVRGIVLACDLHRLGVVFHRGDAVTVRIHAAKGVVDLAADCGNLSSRYRMSIRPNIRNPADRKTNRGDDYRARPGLRECPQEPHVSHEHRPLGDTMGHPRGSRSLHAKSKPKQRPGSRGGRSVKSKTLRQVFERENLIKSLTEPMTPELVAQYLASIGRKGGQKSRRKLTKAQARAMVRARTAKRAALRSRRVFCTHPLLFISK